MDSRERERAKLTRSGMAVKRGVQAVKDEATPTYVPRTREIGPLPTFWDGRRHRLRPTTLMHMATAFSLPRAAGMSTGALATRAHLWREVVVFLAVTGALSVVLNIAQRALGLDLAHLDLAPGAALALIPLLAAAPGIGALVTRVLFQRSLRGAATDWGLRTVRGIGRAMLVAALLPCLYVPLAYLGVYAFGLGGFNRAALDIDAVIALVGGGLAMAVLALFEEVGWRGFLVPSLARLVSGPAVLLLSGLAWAAFHYPLLMLLPGGNHGLPELVRGHDCR